MSSVRTLTQRSVRGEVAWFDRGQQLHVWASAVLTFAIAAVFAAPLPIGDGAQLLVLALAVSILGVPHGALDHLVGRRLLRRRLGSRWPLAFFPAYLASAGAVVLTWWLAPRMMLAIFLVYSIWHFGTGDLSAAARRSGASSLLAPARGLVPVSLPAVFHPDAVTRYFNWLLPESAGLSASLVWTIASVSALAAASLIVAVLAARVRGAFTALDGIELIALTVLFASAPPLISFLVYFCIWHSIRHLLELGHDLSPGNPRVAMRRVWRSAWPLTLGTIAIAAVALVALRLGGSAGEAALGQVVFIGLAALTVPHMILGSLIRRFGE